ncbi:MAG: glycosyltransferase family 4 protein [bacterium]|nr:glycosyltransferase family 4 protein [bacterium]
MRTLYINGRFLTQPLTGVQRYASEVMHAMDERLAEPGSPRVILVAPYSMVLRPMLHNIEIQLVGRRKGHLWEQLDLLGPTSDGVLLSLTGTGPVRHPAHFVTIHDAGVFANPRNFSLGFRAWYRVLVPLLRRRARGFFTVSEFSRAELARLCRIPSDKVVITYNGCDHIMRLQPDDGFLERNDLQRGGYVLCVGADNPNKNLRLVRDAIALVQDLNLELVNVGATNDRVFRRTRNDSDVRQRDLGHVSDEALIALYKGALCLTFPSLYEGFGIPPLEAMCHACPVIAARSSALPETCGDAALFCDPHDPRELADHVRHLAETPAERERLIAAGTRHASGYTWARAAEGVLNHVRGALVV